MSRLIPSHTTPSHVEPTQAGQRGQPRNPLQSLLASQCCRFINLTPLRRLHPPTRGDSQFNNGFRAVSQQLNVSPISTMKVVGAKTPAALDRGINRVVYREVDRAMTGHQTSVVHSLSIPVGPENRFKSGGTPYLPIHAPLVYMLYFSQVTDIHDDSIDGFQFRRTGPR
ncbi:hypothetical protein C8R44DRAFT_855637 [Mycena epipterygia]|nr:hypothetical protein C8R44DRAFT_855637 [Mycena epipterygia]